MEDYIAMLSDDGEKLLEKLVNELGKEIIDDYAVNTSSNFSLPPLPSSDEALHRNKRILSE